MDRFWRVSAAALISFFAFQHRPLAADPGQALRKASYSPANPATSAAAASDPSRETILFSAPPRGSEDEERAVYDPIARYLAKAIGREVVYRYTGSWGVYQTAMLKGDFDILFDGPHFNSFRHEHLKYNTVVKAPGNFEFVVFVHRDAPVTKISELVGRPVCTHAPPNLGTLILLAQFPNPMRQPFMQSTEGWGAIHDKVATHECIAGVSPLGNLRKADKDKVMRIVFQEQPLPNQAFSVSPRLSSELQLRIQGALVAPEAEKALEPLRSAYALKGAFAVASNSEYAGYGAYLKGQWGFEN
jgi:ABC-type phosphate/phosphonate transport system substrate-binding protein